MDLSDEKGGDAAANAISQPTQSDNSKTIAKRGQVEQASKSADLRHLVQLADSTGGLLDDSLRQLAWPVLLDCPARSQSSDVTRKNLPEHRDEEQVQKDVDRAFVFYPDNDPPKVMAARKVVLFDLIVRVLRNHPMLCYFQGFHDIAQVILLVLGAEAAYPVLESICLFRIRDYMLPTMAPSVQHLRLLPRILQAADPDLAKHLTFTTVQYALPSAITLYAHVVEQYSDIARLFDFILAHEPVMSIYLFAAIIISRRDKLLEIPAEDHDILFFTLQKLPQPLDLEQLVSGALDVFKRFPPERLPGWAWWNVSSSSVLKTMRNGRRQQVDEAEACYHRQAAEAERRKNAEERWNESKKRAMMTVRTVQRHRRPIATTAAALAIGIFSFWMKRSGNDRHVVSFVSAILER